MRSVVIKENTELNVDDETAAHVISMLVEEPDLPLSIKNNTITFADYTVGSLCDIFEKYVRKIVTKGIDAYVAKWDKPQKIAALDDGN